MKRLLYILFLIPALAWGQTQFKTNQINGGAVNKILVTGSTTTTKIDSLDWVASTKTLSNGVQSLNHTADTLVWSGNSLTFGYNLTNKPYSTFAYQVSTSMGYKHLNLGVSGATVASASVPYKYTHRKLLFNEFGFNDASALGTDTATFHSNYNTYVNTAIARGWAGNQMIFLSICGVSSQRANAATLIMYNTVISQVAAHYGGTYIDMWNSFQLPVYGGIGLLNNGDQTHPNGAGAVVYAQIIKAALNSPNFCFDCTTPSSAMNTIEANNLYLKNTISANYGSKNLSKLMLDSTGRLVTAPLRVLPDSTITGQRFIFTGSWFQSTSNTNVYLPASGTGTSQFNYNQDIGFLQNTKFVSATTNGTFTPGATFNLYTTNGHTEYRNYGNGGHHKFYVSGGTSGNQSLALDIDQTMALNLGAGVNIAQNSDLYSGPAIGSISARIKVFASNGLMDITNYYQPGPGIKFFTAPVTSGTVVQAAWIPPSGNLILGNNTIDAGFNLDVTNTSRFESTANFGIVASPGQPSNPTTSSTGGALTAGTYVYEIVGVDANNNLTTPGIERSVVVASGTTNSNTVNGATVTGAVSYRIYVGTTSGNESKYFTATSFPAVDVGTYTTATPPTKNQTSLANISSGGIMQLNIIPTTSASTYDILTRNTSTGVIEKVGSASFAQKQHTIFTPATAGTVNLINNQYNIINPSGTIATLTVNLPSSPANNDAVYIKYTQTVTTVTYGNGTVVDGITAPTAGGLVVLTYDSGTASWY